MQTKTQAVTSDAFAFPCPRRAMPIKPSKPETNSQTAAGIGTATLVPVPVPNENTTLEITNDQSRWLAAGSTQFQA